MIKWHRLFGLGLMDYFEDTAYDVEIEKDLSIKQQFLDVLVIEKRRDQRIRIIQEPCDGLDNMCRFNLVTFKSLHEPLDLWAIEELMGHYVNFRKLIGMEKVTPDEIQLYAVCTRSPEGLKKRLRLNPVRAGVYDLEVLSQRIRVIILNQVPKTKRNALWALFSSHEESVAYGRRYYEWNRSDWSKTLSSLCQGYQYEGLEMTYTIEDFHKEFLADFLANCSLGERLAGLQPEEVLRQYRLEERLAGLRPEERLAGLRPEERLAGLRPEERLAGLNLKERLAGLNEQEIRLEFRREEASTLLQRQVNHRFRDVPAWAQEKIAKADLPTLEAWSLHFVDAQSLEALFIHPHG